MFRRCHCRRFTALRLLTGRMASFKSGGAPLTGPGQPPREARGASAFSRGFRTEPVCLAKARCSRLPLADLALFAANEVARFFRHDEGNPNIL